MNGAGGDHKPRDYYDKKLPPQPMLSFFSGDFPNLRKLTLLKGEKENIVNTSGISK